MRTKSDVMKRYPESWRLEKVKFEVSLKPEFFCGKFQYQWKIMGYFRHESPHVGWTEIYHAWSDTCERAMQDAIVFYEKNLEDSDEKKFRKYYSE